jgi:hypothetical protein
MHSLAVVRLRLQKPLAGRMWELLNLYTLERPEQLNSRTRNLADSHHSEIRASAHCNRFRDIAA